MYYYVCRLHIASLYYFQLGILKLQERGQINEL